MSKSFQDADKIKWLELYEKGKSEKWIARERAHCDAENSKEGN